MGSEERFSPVLSWRPTKSTMAAGSAAIRPFVHIISQQITVSTTNRKHHKKVFLLSHSLGSLEINFLHQRRALMSVSSVWFGFISPMEFPTL